MECELEGLAIWRGSWVGACGGCEGARGGRGFTEDGGGGWGRGDSGGCVNCGCDGRGDWGRDGPRGELAEEGGCGASGFEFIDAGEGEIGEAGERDFAAARGA